MLPIQLSVLNQFLSLKVQFGYPITSLNNKIQLKIFNYHTNICKSVRKYEVFTIYYVISAHKYDL